MNKNDIQLRADDFEKQTEQVALVRKQITLIEQLEDLGGCNTVGMVTTGRNPSQIAEVQNES